MPFESAMTLLETLRFNANRKSDLDRDKRAYIYAKRALEQS